MENISNLIEQVRQLVLSARREAFKNINHVQLMAYFEIGGRIIMFEQAGKKRAEYGKKALAELSDKLTGEFGRGFSRSNLEYMRKFYILYEPRISQTLSGKSQKIALPSTEITQSFRLSWSHYVFLMGIKNIDERNFYEIEAANAGWSLNHLKRQYDSSLYERLALSSDKKKWAKLSTEGLVLRESKDIVKNPLVLEFLGLEEKTSYSESELESAIIDKLEHFLLELGKGFLFEARQKRFSFGTDHFFVDLVFYNRLLRCYVLIDLKIGRLVHQDIGQMQMYVNYFDRFEKKDFENPTIGIILCKSKHDALVELTLPKDTKIFATEYQMYLPSKEELKRKLMEWSEEEK